MKVRDLQSKLEAFDPDLDLLCYCEDEESLPPDGGFKLFEIEDIGASHAEPTRLKDDTPYLKLGKTDTSTVHVLLNLTGDY